MDSQWVMDELQHVALFDKRLELRLKKLLDCLSKASTASIPAACCHENMQVNMGE